VQQFGAISKGLKADDLLHFLFTINTSLFFAGRLCGLSDECQVCGVKYFSHLKNGLYMGF
jgi:hypothetical protein